MHLAHLGIRKLTDVEIAEFKRRGRLLCNMWIKIGQGGGGQHGPTVGHIPPYMHCAYEHVPFQLKKLGTSRVVTCQGEFSLSPV